LIQINAALPICVSKNWPAGVPVLGGFSDRPLLNAAGINRVRKNWRRPSKLHFMTGKMIQKICKENNDKKIAARVRVLH